MSLGRNVGGRNSKHIQNNQKEERSEQPFYETKMLVKKALNQSSLTCKLLHFALGICISWK